MCILGILFHWSSLTCEKSMSGVIYRLNGLKLLYNCKEGFSVTMAKVAKHILFTGRVQGVGFRFTAYHIATRYNLTGEVRNLPDGTVEMTAQGHSDNVEDAIDNLKKTFMVTEAKISEVPINPGYKDFQITF